MPLVDVIPLTFIPRPHIQRFTYRAKDALPRGTLVRVFLRNKIVCGIVAGSSRLPQTHFVAIKPIHAVLSGTVLLPPWFLDFAEWCSRYYVVPLGFTLSAMLPRAFRYPTKNTMRELAVAAFKDTARGASRLKKTRPTLIFGRSRLTHYEYRIARALKRNAQVLFLVPEIARIAEVRAFLRKCVAETDIAEIHGSLSGRQESEVWLKIRRGETRVIIGTRSAIFSPLKDTSLIIVDDEGNSRYKSSEQHPKFHVRTLAMGLAARIHAELLFGSAVPSLELFFAARKKEIRLVTLQESRSPATVYVVDPRPRFLSDALDAALADARARSLPSLIFVNRLGTASLLHCRSCDFVFSCTECSAPMPFYKAERDFLRCRHCGIKQEVPAACPSCRSLELRGGGIGIARIAEILAKCFPAARIGLLNSEATPNLSAQKATLDRYARGEIDILLATQMILGKKLTPLPHIVAMAAADQLLAVPEFRAEEDALRAIETLRDFVAPGGSFILQTVRPDFPLFQNAAHSAYASFVRAELAARNALALPPAVEAIKFRIACSTNEQAEAEARKLTLLLARARKEYEVLDGYPAFIPKKKGEYLWNVLVKVKRKSAKLPLRDFLYRRVPSAWDIDVDPASLL